MITTQLYDIYNKYFITIDTVVNLSGDYLLAKGFAYSGGGRGIL
jgi:hypothetical protein